MPRTLPLLLLCLLLALASGTRAGSADATDEAFGLLLAMPEAQPSQGGWVIPFEAAQDERDLITQWGRLKKQGADFNVRRHRGTLLAHAIRAGQQRAALWLLRNGADPRKKLLDGSQDAYDLAREYKRRDVVRVLEAHYGFKPAKATKPAAPARQKAAPAAEATVPLTVAVMRRLAALVEKRPVAAQQEWQRHLATLGRGEFQAIFKDGAYLHELVALTRELDGGLDDALGRLPPALVRAQAQLIAEWLADRSYVSYGGEPRRPVYTGSARSWPALWKRLEQPLDYSQSPYLAARIPPALWPGLFASGYAEHDADITYCVLAGVDLAGLQALWPDFQRYFTNAREAAPGLVLAGYRISQQKSPCNDGSGPAETAAKLAFLRAQGVTGPVDGLRNPGRNEPLAEQLAAFRPTAPVQPRLVRVASSCELVLDEPWLDALARVRTIGEGVPATSVRAIALPGQPACALMVSGNGFPEYSRESDNFSGPSRDPPLPRCVDAPDDGEIWAMQPGGVRAVSSRLGTRGTGFSSLREVRDLQTGKHYWLDSGQQGAACSISHQLPEAYEWQTDATGLQLVRSPDDLLVERLLRQQCQGAADDVDVDCPQLDEPEASTLDGVPLLERLRQVAVPLADLVEALGTDRRAAYRAALAAHDHARLRQLLASGIPPAWTAAEISALDQADLPLQEKRHRIALLFADARQLAEALSLGDSRLGWLPRQDWGPILRIIAERPDAWYDVARAMHSPADVNCDIDHALGLLCGGGLKFD